MMTAFKVFLVMMLLILPLTGSARRSGRSARQIQQTTVLSRYAINRSGKLRDLDREDEREEELED